MDALPLYRRLADHYLDAIRAGALAPGDRMPSVRKLMRLHGVSLSTALQLCRQLEQEGWLEARPRSGYFVQRQRAPIARVEEPGAVVTPDPAQYVGIHESVSRFRAKARQHPVHINLAGARAAPSLYPGDALKQVAIRALRNHADLLVKFVAHTGNPHFRNVLARRALTHGMAVSPDDIIVTHGCSEGVHLALQALAQPGSTIAIESPAYFGVLQVLESLGLRAIEIPTSPHTGISLDALELAMQAYPHIKAVLVVPHLQNPFGCVMPDSHKARLVQLCERAQVPLIEDDTYIDLVDSAVPLKPVKAWDTSDNVIYCASLNKILAPGMRLGWMLAGRWHARIDMLKVAQMRQNDEWPQIIAAEFMASPDYDRHVRRLRNALHAQRRKVADAIARYFPAGTRLSAPAGGTLLWIELPRKLSADLILDAALQEGIMFAPGSIFSNSNRFDHCMRINCGIPYSPELDHALRRLGEITMALAADSACPT